jgi:ketosteroid isomerase-like protein
MTRSAAIALAVTILVPARTSAQAAATAVREVFAAESTFAVSFARRDTAAFAALLAPDAVFFGRDEAMHGKAEVVEGWRPLLTAAAPPFSWKPERVEVLASGMLAHSSGPVYNRQGKQTGTFNSIWRREPDGRWLVVFDKGCPVCDCERKP